VPEPNLPRLRIEPKWLATAHSRARPQSDLIHSELIEERRFPPAFALYVVVRLFM
jgi:hypothetical protein